jgi:hypothetical protein
LHSYPQETEGAGNAGCAARTHSLACELKKHTSVVATGQAASHDIPRANGFNGFLRDLPGVHDFLVTVACRLQRVGPARADIATPRDLTPAKGCQDHTTSPSASTSLAWRYLCVHRIPRPTLVTIAKRPSCERGTARACRDDLPDRHSEIFFVSRLDTPNQIEMPQQIKLCAHVISRTVGPAVQKQPSAAQLKLGPALQDVEREPRQHPARY